MERNPASVTCQIRDRRRPAAAFAAICRSAAARQAVFYLGAFPGRYDAAMVVVADASAGHTFHKGRESLKPELIRRFGLESNVRLVTVKIV